MNNVTEMCVCILVSVINQVPKSFYWQSRDFFLITTFLVLTVISQTLTSVLSVVAERPWAATACFLFH